MICGWGCTGCGWRESSPRSARRTCGSAWLRPGSCSPRREWSCPRRRWGCCMSGRRVAGLRLAALSLAGHPDPEQFAAEFSGSERTVAEYLLAEVLERQSEEVRRLLLRISVLDRVSGPLADLLTGSSGGERVL